MTYVGLDDLVSELRTHHRGCEVVVYAFDHLDITVAVHGGLTMLDYKFTGTRASFLTFEANNSI